MTAPAFDIDKLYQGRRVPPWLRRFSESPDEALHELLVGRAYLEHLNAAEPSALLCDWMASRGEDLVRHVDRALAAWISRHWGQTILPESAESALLSAQAWRHAFDVVGREPRLTRSLKALRHRFPADRAFLASITEGRSRDSEGRAWLALALRQSDRSFLDRWWWLCDLPAEVPWWYGRFGIHGLRHLPEERPGTGGGFPSQVADGLVQLATALERRVQEGWLDEKKAEREFLGIARRAMWAANFPDKWLPFWSGQIRTLQAETVPSCSWFRSLFPADLKDVLPGEKTHVRRHIGEPTTLEEIKRVAGRLSQNPAGAVEEAQRILERQQTYADATGDHHFVVRTAVNFAGRIRSSDPEQALEWTRLGRRYDPRNAHAWTTETKILQELGRLDEAARMAFESIRRFPYDAVAHTTLGEVLKAQDRLREAEWIYRDAVRRFPENDVARNGLAEVLRAQVRLGEAEQIYLETVERFPDDYVAPTGLADVLALQRRYEEAEALYRRVLETRPNDRPARTGLDKVQRARRGETISEWSPPEERIVAELRERSPKPFDAPPGFVSRDVEILLQDAYLLRRWWREADPAERSVEARRLLGALAPSADERADIAGEVGILGIEAGDSQRALELLRMARKRFPGSARVTWALARAETLAAEAEARRHWRLLGRLDAQLRPLQLLGEARLLATGDESDRNDALDDLGELGRWVRQTLDRAPEDPKERAAEFLVGWAEGLDKSLFQGSAKPSIDDMSADEHDSLLERLQANDDELARHALIYLDHREPSRWPIAA